MTKNFSSPTFDIFFNQALVTLEPRSYLVLELLRRWATFQHGHLPAFSIRSIARITRMNFRTAQTSIQQLVKNNFIIPYPYNPTYKNTLYRINWKKVPRLKT